VIFSNTQPIRHNETLFLRVREWMPKDQRSEKDFFFVSFSLSAIFWLVMLFPGLLFLNAPHAGWSTLMAATVIFINFVVWFIGVPLVWVHSIFQITIIALIISMPSTWGVLHRLPWFGSASSPSSLFCGFQKVELLLDFHHIFVVLTMFFAQSKGLIDTGEAGSPALWASMIGLLAITQAMLVITYDSANSEHIRNIKRKNEQLRNLTERLQAAKADKDKFLATVSHELRTPFNVSIGYLDLLNSNRQLPSKASEQVKHALNSSSILLTVVNDLLDYTQIKQGQLAFVPQTIQLKNVIFEAHSALAAKASKQKPSYFLELSDKLPSWAHIDPNRLTQIIYNLLSNAIKFTPKGFVELRADYIPINPASGNLHLRVKDSGAGIPLDSQQSVFEPFVQLDNDHRATHDDSLRGNGLGLSIVESLIRSWGGSIQLLSTPHQGTCFDVWLPF
jgi:signal transduction histidine kinase